MGLNASNVVAWHGRDAKQHNDLVDTWAAKQYRTLTLSLYGTTSSPLFAAVMVKRPTVIAEHQTPILDQAGLQKAFDEHAAKKWGPFLITASGPKNSAVFVASFTPMSSIPLTRLNLSKESFMNENDAQMAAGNILSWVDVFGTDDDPRYAAIWKANPDRVAWSCEAVDESAGTLQARFDALVATWCRPSIVSVTPAQRYLEVFVDSTIGGWSSGVAMTADEYQKAYDDNTKNGLWPVHVSASGAGGSERFAAVFASREGTDPRAFRSSGPVTVPAIDAAMEKYVRGHNLRGVSLAITRGSRLVYAKGYTFAEASPMYPDVTPTTLFRQASCSKTFAAVALWRLLADDPNVSRNSTMQSILKLKQPDGSAPADSRFNDITLRHLLESNSGVSQGLVWAVEAASDAAGGKLPASHAELASYIASRPLTGTPGSMTNVVYGNTDYFLLGLVVAKLAGTSTFEAALQKVVLGPLKMTRTRGSVSDITVQPDDEARHHMRVYNPTNSWPLYPMDIEPSVRHADKHPVAAQYGSWDYEMFDGCGGLSSAVVDMARLIAMFSDRSANPLMAADTIDAMLQDAVNATNTLSGPDAHGYHGFDWATTAGDSNGATFTASKGGWLPGQETVVRFTTGGFGYAIARNGNGAAGVTTEWADAVAAAAEAHDWGSVDLFPQYGMPSLAPTLIAVPTLASVAQKLIASNASVKNVEASMAKQAASVRRPRVTLRRPPRPGEPPVRVGEPSEGGSPA